LCNALTAAGDELHVLTDRSGIEGGSRPYSLEEFARDAGYLAPEEERLRRAIERHERVLVDVTQRGREAELPRLMRQCEQVWWLVEPRYADSSLENLADLLARDRSLISRVHLVWILRESERFAPVWDADKLGLTTPDFKVVLADSASEGGVSTSIAQRQSLSRLVRHLNGTRIGLALGGGGARGLSHLGALRAFERAGIDFDLMSGASSGAMTGLSYAAGWPPDEALRLFTKDLTPHRLLRALPAGAQWYMYAMFRLGAWDRKLRAYVGDARLEQLRIPFSTVAVDLVQGRQVVRDRGDMVNAILESINLPVIAPPIMRDGMALVDGGILNNLPGDVLPERGAALVVGIDIVAKLPRKFAKRVQGAEGRFRKPGMLETLLRVNEVQDYGLTAIRAPAIDLTIAPDTSAFEFADFTRGFELAEIGEAATEEALPQLKQMIAELSRKD
jgi:predicted acylesterase/phospholipase RssA